MHPLFKSKAYLLQYLIAWIPLGLALGFVLAVTGRLTLGESLMTTAPIVLLFAAVCLSAWFVARSFPPGSALDWRAILLHQNVAAMLASAIILAFAHFWVYVLNSSIFPGLRPRFAGAVPALGGMCWLIYLLAQAISQAWIAMESSRKAEVLSREAELKALKAQINPHFLFNSLNSISALTSVDAQRARDMCIRLSDFLRTSLRLGESVSIPLRDELALTRSYLSVEQVRFGPRLRVVQDFDPSCENCDIPPLLVQPLVENAIKHGIATLVDGGEIAVTGRRDGRRLQLMVENPFDPDAPATKKGGFGLVNVRNRLLARYGSAAQVEIEVDHERYRVILSLPCDENTQALKP